MITLHISFQLESWNDWTLLGPMWLDPVLIIRIAVSNPLQYPLSKWIFISVSRAIAEYYVLTFVQGVQNVSNNSEVLLTMKYMQSA